MSDVSLKRPVSSSLDRSGPLLKSLRSSYSQLTARYFRQLPVASMPDQGLDIAIDVEDPGEDVALAVAGLQIDRAIDSDDEDGSEKSQ